MCNKNHFQRLINMYAAAPINRIYEPTMEISEGKAEIEIELTEKYHHAAGGVCSGQVKLAKLLEVFK